MSVFRLICPYARLPVERGVAALVDGAQVAVFRTPDGALHAVSDAGPSARAVLLSRGTVGSRDDRPTVASPGDSQVYDLATGVCLDDPAVRLSVHRVRVRDGLVEVAVEAALSA